MTGSAAKVLRDHRGDDLLIIDDIDNFARKGSCNRFLHAGLTGGSLERKKKLQEGAVRVRSFRTAHAHHSVMPLYDLVTDPKPKTDAIGAFRRVERRAILAVNNVLRRAFLSARLSALREVLA